MYVKDYSSIQAVEAIFDYTVLPNPTTSQITITSDEAKAESLTITNVLGQEIIKETNCNINAEDFVRSGDEKPTKDGNYLCICKHGYRHTVEKQSFYAKVNDEGYARNNDQWGFSCEHIPSFCKTPSYPVVMWSPKSYKPFKERK